MQDGSRKAIIAAFFANLGISVAKFVGFLLTGSAGLLAEAGHSVADTGNQNFKDVGAAINTLNTNVGNSNTALAALAADVLQLKKLLVALVQDQKALGFVKLA